MKKLYLLHGQGFLKKRAKEKIISEFKEKHGKNVIFFSIDPVKLSDSLTAVQVKLTHTALFSEKELLVIKIPSEISSAKNKIKPLCKALIPLLEKIPDHIYLILDFPFEIDHKNTLFKKISNTKAFASQCFPAIKKNDKATFLKQIIDYLKKEKANNVDRNLLLSLIEKSSANEEYIFSALDQGILLSRALGDKLKNSDYERIWNLKEEKSIFKLLDAISAANKPLSLQLAYELSSKEHSYSGKEVESVLSFTGLFARHIRQLIAIKCDVGSTEASRNWGVPGFIFYKLKGQAACFNLETLVAILKKLITIQEKAKSGLVSPLPLIEFFILYFASKKQPPQSA